MKSSVAVTSLIQMVVDRLAECGYSTCAAARAATGGAMPCCHPEDGCGSYTVTAGVTRLVHTGTWPSAVDPNRKCAFQHAYTIEMHVARCYSVRADNALIPDDALAGELLDVLDCINSVWGCTLPANFTHLDLVAIDRRAAGECVGWTVTMLAGWAPTLA